jgi:protein TonB
VKGGRGLEEEAVRVIRNMPNWSVGKNNGRPVPVIFNYPVKFTLAQ